MSGATRACSSKPSPERVVQASSLCPHGQDPGVTPSRLDAQTLAALRDVALNCKRFTAAKLDQIDRRYSIESRYGMSKARLRTLLRRLRAEARNEARDEKSSSTSSLSANAADPPPSQSSAKVVSPGDWPDRLKAHRHRQNSVAAILDSLFGPLAQCRPELWGRRAYCMLVGMIYERLAACEHEIENDELVALAKILAENRRSETKAAEIERRPESESPNGQSGELPENFSSIVRRIYGTNFDPPSELTTDEPAATAAEV